MRIHACLSPRQLALLSAALLLPIFGCGAWPPPEEEPPQDGTCGGLQGLACDEGEFCNYDVAAQCGAADQTGTCTSIPTICTKDYRPVCGCDGQTYANTCTAHASGVSAAALGECESQEPGGETCGGIASLPCDEGEFCNYEAAAGGQGCDGSIADAAGVCAVKPEGCTLQYDPVCGCDGNSYGNACAAHAQGVSVASKGECEAETDGVSCDKRELRCRRAEPACPEGQVPEIVNGCYGACVPIDACACDEPEDCSTDSYTCHRYKGRCGPYV